MAGMYCLNDLLGLITREGAAELRLQPDAAPAMLLRGKWSPLDVPRLGSDDILELFQSFAATDRLAELRRCGDTQFNHSFPKYGQFSIKATFDREKLGFNLKRLSS